MYWALPPFSDMLLWRACMQGTVVRRSGFRWWERGPIPLERWLLLGVYTKQARRARGIVRKARVPQEGGRMSKLLLKQIELGLSLPVLSPLSVWFPSHRGPGTNLNALVSLTKVSRRATM